MSAAIERRWAELSPLLDAALELEPKLRAAWIERHGVDPELRTLLRAMVDAAARANILDHAGASLAEPLLSDTHTAGRRIGAWQLLRPIGAGGMASVYLAERADSAFVQLAAIKILRVGVLDAAEQRRFARERSLLASLEHPHIARLIDGGITVEGAPWFALEYIEGERITRWCDTQRLATRARVRLFLDVCGAVRHAHRNLIVHRDLKPSNILVDRNGVVKLLDFGIAKLLDEDSAQDATGTEQRRLTPAYAAPEQFSGAAITTATDVYALGLLLHELLGGARPEARTDGSLRSLSAAIDVVPERLAARGARHASELRRELRGDLDAIVQTATRCTPVERYDSAAQLADELELYLAGKPIRARADSLWYRLSRFAWRHASLLAGTAVVLATLVLATVVSVQQARVAEREARRAQVVQRFLVGLFESARPSAGQRSRASVEDLIAEGARKARRAFADDPGIQAELLFVTGGLLRVLGQYDDAEIQLRQARQVEHQQLGFERHGALRTRRELALIAKDRMHLDEAERELRAVLVEQRRAGVALIEQASTLLEWGMTLSQLGRHEEAIATLREGIAMNMAIRPINHDELATSWNNLGTALTRATRYEEAIDALQTALSFLTSGTVEFALTQGNLATLLRRAARYDEARDLYASALAIQRRLLPADHPETALTLGNQGVLARFLGQFEDSARSLEEALAMWRRIYGEEHPRVAETLGNLSSLAWAREDFTKAESYAREALAMIVKTRGPDHEHVAWASVLLADALASQGRGEEAVASAERAVAIREHALGDSSPLTVGAIGSLARAQQIAGRAVAARALLEQSLAAIADVDTGAPLRVELGRLLLAQDEPDAAKTQFEAARTAPDITALLRADAWSGVADAEHALGQRERARDALTEARRLLVSTLPAAHPSIFKLDRRALELQ